MFESLHAALRTFSFCSFSISFWGSRMPASSSCTVVESSMTAGAQPEGVASPAACRRTSAQEVRLLISPVSWDSTSALPLSLHCNHRDSLLNNSESICRQSSQFTPLTPRIPVSSRRGRDCWCQHHSMSKRLGELASEACTCRLALT